jgi:hypothetical protein
MKMYEFPGVLPGEGMRKKIVNISKNVLFPDISQYFLRFTGIS